jgi:hypothetical protein
VAVRRQGIAVSQPRVLTATYRQRLRAPFVGSGDRSEDTRWISPMP